GIPQTAGSRRFRCDGLRRTIWILPVQPLVFKIGKENGVAVNEVGAAAILVRARPGVEAGRDRIGRRAILRATDDGHAAGFVRTAFEPVKVPIGKLQLTEADTRRRQQRARDRRFPGTETRSAT